MPRRVFSWVILCTALSQGKDNGNKTAPFYHAALLTAEVCHALSKYVRGGYMEVRDAVDCGRDALSLVDRFVDDSALWVESLSEAVRLDHSSYDMFYLLLARRECATLFTLDRKLQDLSSRCGVNCVCSIEI